MAVVAGMKQPNDHATIKVERECFEFNRLLFEALLEQESKILSIVQLSYCIDLKRL